MGAPPSLTAAASVHVLPLDRIDIPLPLPAQSVPPLSTPSTVVATAISIPTVGLACQGSHGQKCIRQVEHGRTMCRACLDRDLARKLEITPEEIAEQRKRKELEKKYLLDQGILPTVADGYRQCSKCPKGHCLPLADFDGNNRTCRRHLAEQQRRRVEAGARQAVAIQGQSPLLTSTSPSGCDATSSSGSTSAFPTSAGARKYLETHEFATQDAAQNFITTRAQTEGVMYINNQVSAEVISLVCHCHGKPVPDTGKSRGTTSFIPHARTYHVI